MGGYGEVDVVVVVDVVGVDVAVVVVESIGSRKKSCGPDSVDRIAVSSMVLSWYPSAEKAMDTGSKLEASRHVSDSKYQVAFHPPELLDACVCVPNASVQW